MEPFRVTFALSRRQRLAVELMPWLPAVAATVGFGVGAAYLSAAVSPGFLLMGLGPLIAYPGLFQFAFRLLFSFGPQVEVRVDESHVEIVTANERRRLPLDGIFQMYKSDGVWTVLHLDGFVLTVPLDALTDEQAAYLKSFARRATAERA